MIWLWIGVIIVSIVLEAVTAAVVSIWFVPAGIVSLILAIVGVGTVWQVVSFFVISFICLILFRRLLKNRIQSGEPEKTNTDRLIGMEAIVTHEIDNLKAVGEVKVGGQIWSARSFDGSVIPEGKLVSIKSIEGVKLICQIIEERI